MCSSWINAVILTQCTELVVFYIIVFNLNLFFKLVAPLNFSFVSKSIPGYSERIIIAN